VLLDFGSARQAVSGRSQILTAVITPGYAPFEQYHEGGSQGPWSDIYGLGAVIYRAITGTKPPDAAARMMGNDPYQSMVGAHIVGYDVEFLRAIDRALELKQPDRPQDVREWRSMLNASFASEGPAARRARDRAESESERLDAEPGGKWGVESERTLREKQMRPVHGPESQSAGSVGPSTFLGKKKPYPATGLVTLMVLVVCLGIGAAIYFASQRSKPKDIAPQVKAQPSVSANTPVAGIPPSSTPSVARWLAEAQHYLDAKDYDKALPLLQKAADAGDPAAIFNLGLLYKNGQGVPQDYSKARPFFQKAAEAGNAAAMYNLGRLYMYGLGIDKDYTKAYEWYQKGAAAGDSYAINGLGVLFRYGDGVSQDYGKARELFQKAVDAGNPLGMLNLGLLYESGAGVVQDYGKASALYQKAVDAGNSEGMNYLGWLYQHGRGVVQDYDKARQLYEKSADAGNSQAMARLGWMYEQGKGVAQDYGKARELCENPPTPATQKA
jgi:TPR repeat protein